MKALDEFLDYDTKMRTYDFTWIKKNSLVQYMKDPHAMSWSIEYKAKRLAEQHELVTIRMARAAVINGCKYFIKVPKENVNDALNQIEEWDPSLLADGAKGIHFYADGKIFLSSLELYILIKTLYS